MEKPVAEKVANKSTSLPFSWDTGRFELILAQLCNIEKSRTMSQYWQQTVDSVKKQKRCGQDHL